MRGVSKLTFRAVIIGLLAAVFVATAGYFSGQVLRLTPFAGNQFPLIVFGPLVLLLILGGVGRRWWFRPGELAVMMVLALAACNIPGGGLLRMLSRTVAMPIHFNERSLAWRNARVLERVPAVMMPDAQRYGPQFMETFLNGSKQWIGADQMPWGAWAGPLSFWAPLGLMLGLATICLALIVHGQWSNRERLAYPIAQFADGLLGGAQGSDGRSLFRRKIFWLGLLMLLAFHVVNGLAAWRPDDMISIPRSFSFAPVLQKYTGLQRIWAAHYLADVTLWPMVVAFGFLIPADVSLSLGISQILWVALMAWLINGMGMSLEGSADLGGPTDWQRAGSALAIAAMIIYTGRRYYGLVLRRAVTFRSSHEAEGYAAWACRVLLVALAGAVFLLVSVGLSWAFAVGLVLLVMVTYLTQARINTESGLIYSLLGWMPSAVLLGLFGARAFGPQALIICGMVCNVFARDTHECLMPFVMNALKISQGRRLPIGRAGSLAAAGFVLALAVGIPFGLWVDHNFGVLKGEKYATLLAPRQTFGAAVSLVGELRREKVPGEGDGLSTCERFARMAPDRRFLWSLGIGFVAVVAISALRLRLPAWPIHPMMFLVWGTWSMALLSHSLLLGWAVKKLVTKFTGRQGYEKTRDLMYGVVAGELLGGLLWMLIGAISYAVTGQSPPRYEVFHSGS